MNQFNERIKLSQATVAKIATIDEFKGLWQGSRRLSPQILGRLKAWVIITSTGASTRIEGASMTDEEIARFLRGLKATRPQGRDEQEVAGYADLLGRIFDHHQTLKLSENWIWQFHAILLHFSKKDQRHRGQYKTTNNTVVMINHQDETIILFQPTPPYLVKPEMERILAWTNEHLATRAVHPILVIANFIFEFLAIHPFRDGNGRLSRVLTNLLLLKAGYGYVPYVSLDEIIEETKAEYYLALRASQRQHKTAHEDISVWIDYLLDALVEQVSRIKKIIEKDQPEKLLSEKQLRIFALFDRDQHLNVSAINALLKGDIATSTVKQVLSRLVAVKLLERFGLGRSTRYRRIT